MEGNTFLLRLHSMLSEYEYIHLYTSCKFWYNVVKFCIENFVMYC